MPKLKLTALTALASILFVSCQKEVSVDTPTSPFQGNYKFLNFEATTSSTVEERDDQDILKSVTISDYTSQNNSGTFRIDATTMSSSNLAYSVDATAKTYLYTNDTLTDSLDFPFQFQAPPSSTTMTYKMIGSDSVYFTSGTMFFNGSTQQTKPAGAKIKIEGDKLYMITRNESDSTLSDQGFTVHKKDKYVLTSTFQKM